MGTRWVDCQSRQNLLKCRRFIGDSGMYEIDPGRLDLAREFDERPYGRHSGELQRVLNRMRGGPNAGRYVIICSRRHREWLLARMGTRPGDEPTTVPGFVFHARAQAEWAVFRLRWRDLTGHELVLDPPA
jgi:hypothetical protein